MAGDGLAQGGDLGGGLVAGDDVAQLGDLRAAVAHDGRRGLAQLGETASRSAATSLAMLAHRLDAGAQGLGLALELVQAAAIVAGQALGRGALDGDGGELLADGVGAALDLLDALERGGELGAGGLALALAVALQPLERRGELDAGGLRGLLVLGADLLELGGDVGAVERRASKRRADSAIASAARASAAATASARRASASGGVARSRSSWSRRAARRAAAASAAASADGFSLRRARR